MPLPLPSNVLFVTLTLDVARIAPPAPPVALLRNVVPIGRHVRGLDRAADVVHGDPAVLQGEVPHA